MLLLFLITACCITSQEHNMSTEDINEILDKLILQTKGNETEPTTDLKDSFIPTVETQPGNDSNIYYFKTYMAPHINYKSSGEMLHVTRRSNKTVQSLEVDSKDHELISEDESFPSASKMTRKSFMEIENHKHTGPSIRYGGPDNQYPEYNTGNMEENYLLDDLMKKEIVADFNTIKENKQLSYTQHAQQNQQLSLHDYPEIVIDHVTYDNDEKDNEYKNRLVKLKATHDTHIQKVVKGEKNNKLANSLNSVLKTRYIIPEEEIEIGDPITPEQFGPKNYLTPEMKDMIDAIIQKKILHDTLLKQTTESESRKQSMLLEKILQKLPEIRQTNSNAKASYALRQEKFSPTEMETLSHLRSSIQTLHRNIGHHHTLTKPYMNVPPVPSKWVLHNRLPSTLLRRSRPEALKRSRLVASLIDRIMSNIDYNYRPVYYDLYKK